MTHRKSMSFKYKVLVPLYRWCIYYPSKLIYAFRARSVSSPVRVRIAGEEFVYDVPLSPGAGLDIAVCGIREPYSSDFFVRTMRELSPDVHVDIGANFGYYATMAGRFASKVVAYEPLSWLKQYLRANLDRERADYSINVAAVYPSESGWVSMEVSDVHNLSRVASSGSLRVPAVPPERILDAVDGSWTLRMDIEGGEKEILIPIMREAASRDNLPRYVFVEFHPKYVSEEFLRRVDRMFRTYGYRAWYFFEPVPEIMCFPGWRVFELLGFIGLWRGPDPIRESLRRGGWMLHTHYILTREAPSEPTSQQARAHNA